MEQKNQVSKEKKEYHLTGHVFASSAEYNFAYKMAQHLEGSKMLPQRYQGNIGDIIIALDMASRLDANPLMVMQNLNVINGIPSWSGQFVIAAINTSGRFKEPLTFVLEGSGQNLSCYARTVTNSGKEIKGTTITMEMARQEGWVKRNPKWTSMPEQMIQYRAASFFGRLYCPDLLMGIYTADEAVEIEPVDFSIVDDKPTPEQVDAEIEQHANQKTIGFDDVQAVEIPQQEEKMAASMPQAPDIPDEVTDEMLAEMEELYGEPDF